MQTEIETIEQETSALENFARELFLEIHHLRLDKVSTACAITFPFPLLIVDDLRWLSLQERIRFSRTLQGKMYNLLGYFLAGYCVYKIIMVR